MKLLIIIENLSLTFCGIALFLWISIGSLARSRNSEILAQKIIVSLCWASAVLLFLLHYLGGELWESRNAARAFAILAIIVALTASLNIKGKDVQGETNPHQIMKMRREEE